jgi:hypothetical protein
VGPRLIRWEAFRVRLESAKPEMAVSVVTVEERVRGWLAEISRHRDPHRQISPYAKLQRQIDLFADWIILPWDADSADLFVCRPVRQTPAPRLAHRLVGPEGRLHRPRPRRHCPDQEREGLRPSARPANRELAGLRSAMLKLQLMRWTRDKGPSIIESIYEWCLLSLFHAYIPEQRARYRLTCPRSIAELALPARFGTLAADGL